MDLDLGTIVPNTAFSYEGSGDAFADTFTLTVDQPVDFLFAFTNLGLGSNATVDVALNGNVIVGAFGRNIEASWGPFVTPPFGPGTQFTVSISGSDGTPLNAAYRFDVFTAGQGGIPPVPEPATWAMSLAGLGATAAVVRRRRRGGRKA